MPNIKSDSGSHQYNIFPDVCPICHHAVSPKCLGATISGEEDKKETYLDIAFKCTLHNCSQLFIGIYKKTQIDQHGRPQGIFNLIKAVPKELKAAQIYNEISELSPSFFNIFNQAHAAESYGLNEIAGVGYRKALEFLIKDYCISLNPSEAENIKSKFLGLVIREYVDDTNIKTCAERAVWLGND